MNIHNIAKKVLDIGRGNSLINYSTTKNHASSYINYYSIEDLYNKIKSNQELNVNKELLCLDTLEFEKSIKKIYDKYSLIKTEQGISCLYLVFGFLKWNDKNNNDINSPLLLIPVQLIKSNNGKDLCYKLKRLDEEIGINLSLIQKLKEEDYRLDIPNFNENINIRDYFNELIKLLPTDFILEDKVVLGVFYNAKMNIYQDLIKNEDKVMSHPFVLAMNGQQQYIPPLDNSKDDSINYTVMNSDASQFKAIKEAINGKSMIIEGPPGTGKSQTITNIISSALAQNKKVLFVAEKRAALQVVYDNLKRVHLDDFCLYLDSNKANRKVIYKNIYDSLMKNPVKVNRDIKSSLDKLKEYNNLFEKYYTDLHSNIDFLDISLYEVINQYINYMDYEYISANINNIRNIDNEDFNRRLNFLDCYNQYLDLMEINDYRDHFMYGLKDVYLSAKQQEEIAKLIEELIYSLEEEKLNELKDFNLHTTYMLMGLKHNPPVYIDINDLSVDKIQVLNEMTHKYIKIDLELDDLKDDICQYLDSSIFDSKKIEDIHYMSNDDKNYNKIMRSNKKILKQYLKKSKDKNNSFDIHFLSNIITYYKKNRLENIKLANDIHNLLKLDDSISMVEIVDDIEKIEWLATGPIEDYKKYINKKVDLEKLEEHLLWLLDYIYKARKLCSYYNYEQFNYNNYKFEDFQKKLIKMQSTLNTYNTYLSLLQEMNNFMGTGVIPFINNVSNLNKDRNELKNLYARSYYEELIKELTKDYPVLKTMSTIARNNELKEYSELDKMFYNYSIAKVREIVTNNRPNPNSQSIKSDAGVIKLQNEKATLYIKDMFSKTQKSLLRVKPIMLMSPLAVATYLPSDLKFDIVIFDEASQILPEDALCAIYRSKQVIVVGDSEQLPPTDFFKKITTINEEYEEDEVINSNSLLNLCHSFLDHIYLKWHYRSKNEELIQFSNKYIYNNSLITFPSYRKNNEDEGVEFYYINDGIYDRGGTRTNKIEASKVVELIIDHIKRYPKRSLGVVSFSIVQKKEIEKQLNETLSKLKKIDDSLYETLYQFINNEDVKEPFFIKNLENIQGDERDTIILSICYGKDKEDHLSCQLGKLTKEEGKKRINVAVSRSKINMKVVCSFNPDEMQVNSEDNTGLLTLKNFLQYAKNREQINSTNNKTNDIFILDIASKLTEIGYKCDIGVGNSNYKVDIGVKNPNNDNEYILGICIDGNSYKNCPYTKDRERLRKEILRKLGWNLIDIWACDYYKNREQVLALIKNQIKNPVIKNLEPEEYNKSKYEKECLNRELLFIPYKLAYYDDIENKYKNDNYQKKFVNIVKDILNIEGPMHLLKLSEKMYKFFGVSKLNTRVIELVKEKLDYITNLKEIGCDYPYYYNKETNEFIFRKAKEKRSIVYIYSKELEDLMYKIIEQSAGIDKDLLYKQICRYCSYKENDTLNEEEYSHLDKVYHKLLLNKLEEKDGLIYIR